MKVIEDDRIEVVDEVRNEYVWAVYDGKRIWIMAIFTKGTDKRMKDVIDELVKKWNCREVHFTNVINLELIKKLRNKEIYLVKTPYDEYVVNVKVIWEV